MRLEINETLSLLSITESTDACCVFVIPDIPTQFAEWYLVVTAFHQVLFN